MQALQARGHGWLSFLAHRAAEKPRWPSTLPVPSPSLIQRQASDLMGKYVGETEQNMAAMFREAEQENGVLLLTTDSYLQPAQRAAQLRVDQK